MVTTGIDLVRIADVTASIRRFGDRYLERIFTDRERSDCGTPEDPAWAGRLAARFAAKEATFKALHIDELAGGWRAIELRRTAGGWCEVVLRGALAQAAQRAGIIGISVSLSHEAEYATAVAVAERTATASHHTDGAFLDA